MLYYHNSPSTPPARSRKHTVKRKFGNSSSPSPKKRRTSSHRPPKHHLAEFNDSTTSNVPQSMQQQRRELPIWTGRDAIISAVKENDTVIILGETGSGKTTQVPQYLYEAGFSSSGMIGVTQTRRVAATSLAARISQERSTPLGMLVGYSVRFEEVSSPNTQIKFLTDGMLVRELLADKLLDRYAVIILDEAHERTLRTDVLISRLKEIQKMRRRSPDNVKRAPLKLIIMSATLDAQKFSDFYDKAKVLYVQGRQHPVKILYTVQPQNDYLDAALRTFFQIHVNEKSDGDVLIFLPGQDDIETLHKLVTEYASQLTIQQQRVFVCPLYSALPAASQDLVFKKTPSGFRKCILSTNIAETAITIPGVKYVIDSGTFKEKNFSSKTKIGVEALITKTISKASALQRAGRAGREGPGSCYRLYTEAAYQSLEACSIPEIQRSNLASSMLLLKCQGIDPESIEWLDSPSLDAFRNALINLFALGAMDKTRHLTDIGERMALLPLEPSFARAIVASHAMGCTSDIVDIVALLSSSSNVFLDISDRRSEIAEARQKFKHPTGDHVMLLNVWRAYRNHGNKETSTDWCRKHHLNERALLEAQKINNQLRTLCDRMGIDCHSSCSSDMDPVLCSIAHGVPQNVARMYPDSSYRQLLASSVVKIHPSSSMFEAKVPAIMYNELVFTSQVYARCVSSIPMNYVMQLPLYSQTTS